MSLNAGHWHTLPRQLQKGHVHTWCNMDKKRNCSFYTSPQNWHIFTRYTEAKRLRDLRLTTIRLKTWTVTAPCWIFWVTCWPTGSAGILQLLNISFSSMLSSLQEEIDYLSTTGASILLEEILIWIEICQKKWNKKNSLFSWLRELKK